MKIQSLFLFFLLVSGIFLYPSLDSKSRLTHDLLNQNEYKKLCENQKNIYLKNINESLKNIEGWQKKSFLYGNSSIINREIKTWTKKYQESLIAYTIIVHSYETIYPKNVKPVYNKKINIQEQSNFIFPALVDTKDLDLDCRIC